jgi:hypothetical protein
LPGFTTTIENIPALDSVVCKTLVGKYEMPSGAIVRVLFENRSLYVIAPEGAKLQLFPSSDYEYFLDVTDLQLTFSKNSEGKVDKMIVHQGGQDIEFKRVE